jgi:hypothetical protein
MGYCLNLFPSHPTNSFSLDFPRAIRFTILAAVTWTFFPVLYFVPQIPLTCTQISGTVNSSWDTNSDKQTPWITYVWTKSVIYLHLRTPHINSTFSMSPELWRERSWFRHQGNSSHTCFSRKTKLQWFHSHPTDLISLEQSSSISQNWKLVRKDVSLIQYK